MAGGGWVEEGRGPRDTELCFHCPRSPPSVCVCERTCVCVRESRDSKVPLSMIFDSLAQPPLCPPSKVSVKQSRSSSVKPTSTQQL